MLKLSKGFKLSSKIVAGLGGGLLALFLLGLFIAVWVTMGALFWGWIIMLITGATGHSMGYSTAFLWGYIPAILTGS